ncbi:hypothetical protein [Planktotalea sp.]|uniref:hypothetical protein n=1 Tax=Planktotalea sp. TaxID=2029877 RepID=UPI003D6A6D1D
MNTPMQITPTEHGVVRLFSIDLPLADARKFDIDALGAALGGVALDAEQVDLINLDDLEDMGLDGYLIHGIGVTRSEVVQLRPQIRALKGHVALIRSAAFGGMAATLTPQKPIRWIATFGEVPLDLTAKPLRSDSAKGTLSSAPVPARNTNGLATWMYATFILIAVIIFTIFAR